MDPLTQGIVGAAAAQTINKNKVIVIITIIGFLAGLAPDIDIFFRSKDDPLLFLEYHRHFTHSIIFIPIGGFICSCIFYFTFTKHFNFSFLDTYMYSTIGYATHGIIDSLTSYGTQLFWPFSDDRFSTNTISIIDPLFTLPLVILVIITAIKNNRLFVFLAIAWIIIYQSLAFYQKERAENIIKNYALTQNHNPVDVIAKPSFGNIILWKVIYLYDDKYYINAVRSIINTRIYPGESIKKLNLSKDIEWIKKESQQYEDIQRFRWFSNGYLALAKSNENIIYDIRFSSLPNSVEGLWGIKLDKNKNNEMHVEYITNRDNSPERFKKLLDMILK